MKFQAHPERTFQWNNGAIGYRPVGDPHFDCLGPFAKVKNCPVDGYDLRVTAYATGYADTFFSVPACIRYKGKHVSGFLTDMDGVKFVSHTRHEDRLPADKKR